LSNRSPIGVNVLTLSSVTVGTNSPGSVDMYDYILIVIVSIYFFFYCIYIYIYI